MSVQADPRRPDKVKRYKSSYSLQFGDDQLQEYMNVLGMIFSMCGLMMKVNDILYEASDYIVIIFFDKRLNGVRGSQWCVRLWDSQTPKAAMTPNKSSAVSCKFFKTFITYC